MKMKPLILLMAFLAISVLTFAQTRSISGKVKSGETNEPLPGATVQIKGTTTGTLTDLNGNFKIDVPDDPNTVIQVSYLGQETQAMAIGSSKEFNFEMRPTAQSLK